MVGLGGPVAPTDRREAVRPDAMSMLSSRDIPQADRTEKVIEVALLAATNRPLSPENLDLSGRHTSYYRAAARAVGLLDEDSKPTPFAADFPSLTPDQRLLRMGEALSASALGRAWLDWARVERLDQVDPDSAERFLLERSDLSPSTAARRARTLRCYLRDLVPHLETVSRFASPRELLLGIYQALDELAAIEAKPPSELREADYLHIRGALEEARSHGAEERPSDSVIDRDYGVFLDAIPRGRELLANVESLASADSFESLVESATKVFVDGLGYSAAYLDETQRTARAEFDRIARIGNFGEVEVVCVSLARINWFARFYEVIYRFHPYAIILSIEPDARTTRFVYREGPARAPRYRVLSGRTSEWEPNDNLVVWAWRLHQLRPKVGEGPQALQARAARALKDDPEVVAADWPSARLPADTEELPGVSWADAPRRAFTSFVQEGCEPAARRRWGLEAVLRDRFPIAVGGPDGPRLHCVGWSLGEAGPDAEVCVGRGLDRVRDVFLDLELRSGEEVSPLRLRTTLPEPDDQGRFVFEGKTYAFTARVRADGRLEALTDGDDEAEEGPDDAALGDAVQEEEGEEEEAPVDDAEDEDQERREFTGASPRAFYEYAVSRKLAGLSYGLFRLRAREEPTGHAVVAHILKTGRRHDHFPLAAWNVLRHFIAPASDGSILRAEAWTDALVPPSWACLDRSAALPGYAFAPVAGARLHPTGSLCVPVGDEAGVRLELVDASATEVNPRAAGASRAAGQPLTWWMSPDLAPFAEARPGSLTDAEAATLSVPLSSRVAITPAERRGAVVADDLRGQPLAPRVFEVRLPGVEAERPELLVELGEEVQGPQPWLRAREGSWRMGSWEPSPYRKLASDVLEETRSRFRPLLDTDCHLIERLPAGARGTVTAASVHAMEGPGNIVHAWVCRLELMGRAAPDVVLGPNGTSYPVVSTRSAGGMPFDADGRFDVLLLEPTSAPETQLRDGRTGEPLPAEAVAGPCRAAASPCEEPSLDLRARALDGEWLARADRCAISERDRLRWILSDDSVADHLASPGAWADGFDATMAAAALTAPSTPRVEGELPDPTRTQLHKPLPEPEPGAAFPLPCPVLHPWRKAAAGALLGVTREELDVLLRRHGTCPVVEALRALADPRGLEAARRRLTDPAHRSARVRLAAGVRELQRLAWSELPDALLLDALPVPHPRLLPHGTPPGASRVLRTPLLGAYRTVKLVAETLQELDDGIPATRRACEAELQAAVDSVFGDRSDDTPEGRTLAGWLGRSQPLTRAASQPVTAPGLVWKRTAQGRAPTLAVHAEEPSLPPLHPAPAPADARWWGRRAARVWLAHDQLPWFVGLFAGCEGRGSDDGVGERLPAPPGLRGRWLAREWLRRLCHPSSDPLPLAELLSRRLPLLLSKSPTEARAAIAPALESSLPGSDPAAVSLREVLSDLLSGFWIVPPSIASPEGWAWLPPTGSAPADARRAVPPLGSPAWRLWPTIGEATSAVTYAEARAAGKPLPPLLSFALGIATERELVAPEAMDAPTVVAPTDEAESVVERAPEIAAPSPEPVPEPAPHVTPTDEVRVAAMSLRRWLAQTRPLETR